MYRRTAKPTSAVAPGTVNLRTDALLEHWLIKKEMSIQVLSEVNDVFIHVICIGALEPPTGVWSGDLFKNSDRDESIDLVVFSHPGV